MIYVLSAFILATCGVYTAVMAEADFVSGLGAIMVIISIGILIWVLGATPEVKRNRYK